MFSLLVVLYRRWENLLLDLQLDYIALWTSLLFFLGEHMV